jgi:hypothetical protein
MVTASESREPSAPEPRPGASASEPIRSSFSLDRYSREAIKRGAEWFGTTQGEIVNLAPLLYALVADVSLQRRREALPMIRTLTEQALRSLRDIVKIAPHLAPMIWLLEAKIDDVAAAEQHAIEHHDVHGVHAASGYGLVDDALGFNMGQSRPYNLEDLKNSPFRTLLRELHARGGGVSVHAMEDGVYEDDFAVCESPEQRALYEQIGDHFARLVISGILSEEEARKQHEDIVGSAPGLILEVEQDELGETS